jgi:hypothetical protein
MMANLLAEKPEFPLPHLIVFLKKRMGVPLETPVRSFEMAP